MCRMASEALLHATSASNKAFHENLKTSEAPSCSFLPSSKAQGLRLHHSRVSCSLVSSQKGVRCQATAPLVKQECRSMSTCNLLNGCNLGQQSASPDRWMEDCVCEIVRNINEAPFLHMLFDSKDSSASIKCQRQRVAESDNWSIEDKWNEMKDSVNEASPDGVILVHHLGDEAMEGYCLRDGSLPGCMKLSNKEFSMSKGSCKATNLWGVLVLGKSIARSACYILKTTSVPSSLGTCTQFCLTKAKCFGPSWHEQAQNSWLLNAESNVHSD